MTNKMHEHILTFVLILQTLSSIEAYVLTGQPGGMEPMTATPIGLLSLNLRSKVLTKLINSVSDTIPEGSTISVASPLTRSTRVTHVRQGADVLTDKVLENSDIPAAVAALEVSSRVSIKPASASPSAPFPKNCTRTGGGLAFMLMLATITS
jgi:hypothetical protein